MARTAFRRTIPLLVALPAALAAQQRAMEPNDWHRVSTVGSATIAPDGKRVAFTVTTIAERENRRHSEIWVVPTAGGTPQRWTSPSTESSNPRWSPDGKYLIALNKLSHGRHLPVGPSQPEADQLIDITGEKMMILSDSFTEPEPHYAQTVKAEIGRAHV